LQALEYVLKQEGFVLTKQDFNSFVSQALYNRWVNGLKAFLASPAVHFFFTTLTFDEQKIFVERVAKFIGDMDDAKSRKLFATSVIEGVFSHRPYVKDLVLVMAD